jgi:hypothetical protein
MKIEDLDAGLGPAEYAVIVKRAGYLALEAAGTLVGVDMQ